MMYRLGRASRLILQRCHASRPAAFNASVPLRSIATHVPQHQATAISILSTNVDKTSADYRDNAAQMAESMERIRELHTKIEAGGSVKARERHTARGKMLPREYVCLSVLCRRTGSLVERELG